MPAGTDPPTIGPPAQSDRGLPEDVRECVLDADRLLVLCDFDGTLSEITEEPDEATVRDGARRALRELGTDEDTDVAIVSGRALDDVRARVGLADVPVAGNHGLEIDVGGESFVHPDAAGTADVLESVLASVRDELGDVPGLRIEDKGLTATVHYRMVDDDADVGRIEAVVRDVAEAVKEVQVTEGRQILELRPAIEWDKGRAVSWITDALAGEGRRPDRIYVGDDVSDEAAFGALGLADTAIRVADGPVDTAADYRVRDPETLASVLTRMAELRSE